MGREHRFERLLAEADGDALELLADWLRGAAIPCRQGGRARRPRASGRPGAGTGVSRSRSRSGLPEPGSADSSAVRRSSMIRWRTGNDGRGFFRLARRFATARASSFTKRCANRSPAIGSSRLASSARLASVQKAVAETGLAVTASSPCEYPAAPATGPTGRRPPISRSGRAGRAGRARRPATPRRGSSTRRCHDSRPPGRACACGGSPRSALPGPPSPRASARSAHPS